MKDKPGRPSIADRVAQTRAQQAEHPAAHIRHIWLSVGGVRVAALHLGWRKFGPDGGWEARVVGPELVDGEWVVTERWVIGEMVTPA